MNENLQPKKLDDFIINKEAAETLKRFDINNLTNIILHGPTGSGKSTLFYAFMRHLFNKDEIIKTHKKLTLNNTEITYMDCKDFLELCPSDYYYQDRTVVTEFIKQMASTRSVRSLFVKEKAARYKIVVMSSVELMTESAMAALRRTVEQYSKNIRLIMITNDISRVMKPIRSRSFCIFVPLPSDLQIAEFIKNQSKFKELAGNEQINRIINTSNGNLHKIFYHIENLKFEGKTKDFRLEYERDLDDLCDKIMKTKTAQTILSARKTFYYLLGNQVLSNLILERMLKNFLKLNKKTEEVLKLFVKYKERCMDSDKEIIHLEAFSLGIMVLFDK